MPSGESQPPRRAWHPAEAGKWKGHFSDWTIWQQRGSMKTIWKCVVCKTLKEGR